MSVKFSNYEGSEMYCNGYIYGKNCALKDIELGNEKQEPLEEKTVYQIGYNKGYNTNYDYSKSIQKKYVKTK